ncbi:hypothetical protein BH11ARM2_BH11ARM2_11540 [soil metagenome]
MGYSGGHVPDPTYRMVCGKSTGHVEVLLVEFDSKVVSYAELLDAFYGAHDADYWREGSQYRSAIFVYDDAQREAANCAIEQRKARGEDIRTEVTDATTFWPAEDYHQQYYEKRGLARPAGKSCLVT